MHAARKIFFFFTLLMGLAAFSQSFNISNFTANNCRAKFYDDGGPTNQYQTLGGGTGGSYTFQIVTGNPVITLTFNPSAAATQIVIGDNITFYKQFPLTAGNIISGPYTNVPFTGTISPVVSTTGSLIVVWNENGNTQGIGWDAGWYSGVGTAPSAPSCSINPVPTCSANSIQVNFSPDVLCDSLKPNFFVITGPMFPGISSVTPGPCNNGTATSAQLFFNNPINKNCTYTLTSLLFRKDKCDSVYSYPGTVTTFSIADCPIQASITATPKDTVCAYSCSTSVKAVSQSTQCLNFNYAWNQGLPSTAGPHAICPTVTTVYSCTMTEQSTLQQTVISRTIYVIDPQILPVASPSMCQSTPPFNFTATPAGGTWSGPGITNSLTGLFCAACTTPGVKTLTYQSQNCFATTQVTIIGVDAGFNDAACLGGPAFAVSGGTPTGGTWYNDPDISAAGVFTPNVAGTHTVFYTVGSCTSVPKQIFVANAVSCPTNVITLCRSQWFTNFSNGYSITPQGGRFTGTGITNTVAGTFSPGTAGAGTQVITYSLGNGCLGTFTVNVLDIDVSPSTSTSCPAQIPFIPGTTLTPLSGTWTSTTPGAILAPLSGSYNPSAGGVNSHTDILVYTAPNGCSDTLKMFAIKTTIVPDSMFFCASSSTFQLSSNTVNINYFPSGGTFSGTAVSMAGPNYVFDPATAGPGVHTVYYSRNTCVDSVKMVVYPTVLSNADRTVCSTHPSFTVANVPPGGSWAGTGIINVNTGQFDPPSVVLPGVYTVTFNPKPPLGCSSQAQITVYQFVAANVLNLNNTYCYKNFNYSITPVPANGTLIAPPTITAGILNPTVTGSGTFDVVYSFGTGACFTKDSIHVTVYPPFTTTATVSKDSLCAGEAAIISVNVGGGLPTVLNHTYTWSHGLPALNQQVVTPSVTTIYTVISTDGCSDPVTNTFQVNVSPEHYLSFVTTSIQCYGVPGQATVNVTPAGNYSYNWNTSPTQSTTVLNGIAGKTYHLKVRNLITGCKKDTDIKVPGYDAIKALFSPNPNEPCIPFVKSNVTFIDESTGAAGGTWTINNVVSNYTIGQSMQYEFKEPGTYTVALQVFNIGNCTDVLTMPICIQQSTEVFIPDIFSPNNDGNNDVLFVRGNGITQMTFVIYDRWGEKVFSSGEVQNGWDGTRNGKELEPGIYAYMLDATLVNDEKIKKKGEITLIR